MRLLATTLALLLGIAVIAGPAAPVRVGDTPRKEKSEDSGEQKRERSRTGPVTERVFLRAGEKPLQESDSGGGTPDVTPDEAPAIRARHLPSHAPYRPPLLPLLAKDARAGLLSIPPPAA
ncbi:MAG: hypothetical protein ACYTGV_07830 [Planctomycetota bacterium]|jgi:hypothetical protein